MKRSSCQNPYQRARHRRALTDDYTRASLRRPVLQSTEWPGMGAWRSLRSPIPLIGIILTLGFFLRPVESCALETCFTKYNLAKESGTTDECVPLRTYYTCVHNFTCSGELMYYQVRQVVTKRMKDSNCSVLGPVYEITGNANPVPKPPRTQVCSYKGEPKYKHCGLFGDPHLRTFDEEFQTCKVEGAWSLIDNEYLTVQVTNDPVGKDGSATATSKLTVLVKSNEGCGPKQGDYVTYEAETHHLPSSFKDGTAYFGREKAVALKVVEPRRHIEIYVRYIDTKILVRQIGNYLTFALRMPEDIVNKTKEYSQDKINLCIQGCPSNERINYQKYLAQNKGHVKSKNNKSQHKYIMPREQAVAKCQDSHVVDFYFDSCVFDLMTTGDTNFTLAANHALRDVLNLLPEAKNTQTNRTDLKNYDRLYKSGAPTHRTASTVYRTFQCFLIILWTTILTNWTWDDVL